MVELLFRWEKGWLEPKTEAFMWRQLVNAFSIDRLLTIGQQLPPRTNLHQYAEMPEALSSSSCERVYLQPKGGTPLQDFCHPADALYVLGCAGQSNSQWKAEADHVVTVYTPKTVDMFAINAAAIALYDRMVKHGC